MTREGLKSQILEQIRQNSSKIIETGEGIFRHPELGFKETRTSGVVRNVLTDLGLEVREGLYFAMWDRALAPQALKAQGGS
jgi:metal-dependent amidase/aminoacylase/carboxypeptidase family protein